MDLPDVPIVSFDTETSGLHFDPPEHARVSVVSLAWGPGPDEVVALPFDQERLEEKRGGAQMTLEVADDPNLGQDAWEQVCDWLASRRLLIGHNLKYDLHMMRAGTRHWPGIDLDQDGDGPELWDTMLACYEVWPMQPAGLKEVVVREGLWESADARDELKEWMEVHKVKRYDLVPWDVMEPYARDDASMTWRLWQHQQDLADENAWDVSWFPREMQVMRAIYRMERRGVAYDVDRSLEAADRLRQKQKTVEADLPFKPTLHAAKQYYFGPEHKGGLGLLPYETTEAGNVSLTDRVLEKMAKDGAGGDSVERFRQYRKYDYAQSMWYRAYAERTGGDGRLRTVFKQGKVVSGRFSVERVNLQSIPHIWQLDGIVGDGVPAVRELFGAREGHRLWEFDLGQAELRVAAAYAGCEAHLDAIQNERDVHGETCQRLFDRTPDDPDWKQMRDIAKRGNFSFIFSVGWDTFRTDLAKMTGIELPRHQAQFIVSEWRRIHPEYGSISRRVERVAERRGWVRLKNGRIRRFADWEMRSIHKAFNQLVQGSIAQLVIDWLLAVEQAFPGTVLLSVHDSIIMELPVEDEDRIAKEVIDIGERLGTEMFDVRMVVEGEKWGAKG